MRKRIDREVFEKTIVGVYNSLQGRVEKNLMKALIRPYVGMCFVVDDGKFLETFDGLSAYEVVFMVLVPSGWRRAIHLKDGSGDDFAEYIQIVSGEFSRLTKTC